MSRRDVKAARGNVVCLIDQVSLLVFVQRDKGTDNVLH